MSTSIIEKLANDGTISLSELDISERQRKVWNLRMQGIPVRVIAESFGYSPQTIYKDLREMAQNYREHLEQFTGLDLVGESLQFLDEIESVALYEVNQLGIGEPEIDEEGKVVRGPKIIPEHGTLRQQFMRTALKAREMKIDLLLATGAIPKEPEKMLHAVCGKIEHDHKVGIEDRTKEEIIESLNQLMRKGRMIEATVVGKDGDE